MTDRDHFAASALSGMLARESIDDDPLEFHFLCEHAYKWADAMLRERSRAVQNATGGGESDAKCTGRDSASCRDGGDCPLPDNATNHDAAPAARARTDAESDRTDKAAPRPGEGTGDTPVTNPLPKEKLAEVSSEPVAWGVANRNGLLATSIHRIDAVDMQSEFACDTEIVPLYRAPDFAPPPPDNAAKAPDNAEPEAWAVCCPGDGNWSPCFFHEPHAQRHASAILGSKNIIPLYRQPTLTDAEREAVERAVDSIASTMPYESQQGLADWKTLRGLLSRAEGEK